MGNGTVLDSWRERERERELSDPDLIKILAANMQAQNVTRLVAANLADQGIS